MTTLMMRWLTPFLRRKIVLIALIWLCVVLFCALFAHFLTPYDPFLIRASERLHMPSSLHWFGTDHFGRDTFSRCMYGARTALIIGLGVMVFALSGGVLVGTTSAYFPKMGQVLMRIVDVLMAFPALLLALSLATILGRGVGNIILAIGIVYMTTTARILYGMTLKIKTLAFVEASIASGAGDTRTLLRHILPNLLSPLMVQGAFIFSFSQLQAAALDFLGLGLPPEIPSWGNMLSESRLYITRASWLLLFPGGLLILTVFSINLVGDMLRDYIDPRYRGDFSGP